MKKTKNPKEKLLTWLEIDRKKLKWNIREIKRITNNSPTLAMLKGNAYGMGIEMVAKTLINEGIKYFGVVGLQEAKKIRKLDKTVVIVDFNPINKDTFKYTVDNEITPIICSIEDCQFLIKYAQNIRKDLKIFIQVNTGLNRKGSTPEEAEIIAKELSKSDNIKIEAISTSLIEIEDIDQKQIEILKNLRKSLRNENIRIPNISYSSSQGILSSSSKQLDLIRVGISLFGIYPDQEARIKKRILLKPVMTLKSRIMTIRRIKKGDRILYKNTYIAPRSLTIGVLPIGYALGYNLLLKGKGEVLVSGKRCQIIGLSMSDMVIDVSQIKKLEVGEEVVLIGKQQKDEITLEELSKKIGVSEYYLMASLSPFLRRVYQD